MPLVPCILESKGLFDLALNDSEAKMSLNGSTYFIMNHSAVKDLFNDVFCFNGSFTTERFIVKG